MSLLELEMPVKCVAELVGEYDQRIWNIFHRHTSRARSNTDYSGITRVGIEETSSRKGHDHVTLGVDLDERRVFEVVEGKDAETVTKLADFLYPKGSPAESVKQVSIDMSVAFIHGCSKNLPNATITFDRFHVVKIVNKAMDELRRAERQSCKELKNQWYP